MNWLVFHLISGDAFFTGIVLLMIAAFASLRALPIFRRITALTFLLGLVAFVLSTTAIPYWCYVVAALATLAWIVSNAAKCFPKKWHRWTTLAFVAVWLLAALVELPYHVMPTLSPVSSRSIAVIGDSVTAGIDADETSETWPRRLAREHDVAVQDISRMGETAASALKHARTHTISAPIVVVEIGGNDLLGPTTTEQFAQDLDALLTHLATPDRQIVLFELPLPPFRHEYGRVQRLVAQRHNVQLIPPPNLPLRDRRQYRDTRQHPPLSLRTSTDGRHRLADCEAGISFAAYTVRSPRFEVAL